MSNNNINSTISPIAKGKRLRSLRQMADLSRKDLMNRHQISASTMQSWEEGKSTGLSPKGAQRIVLALQAEGVQCTTEWLLTGMGETPYLTDKLYTKEKEKNLFIPRKIPETDEEILLKERHFFRRNNHNVIDMIIADDGMLPFYAQGDLVAGKMYFGADIDKLIARDCIIETKSGEMLCRRLRKGTEEDCYHLQCLNIDTTVSNPFMYDVPVLSVAPIIWHRQLNS